MMPVIEYVHAIEGRLRIKVPEVKRAPARARQLEERFRAVEGIRDVRANPLTGNVLFLHDPRRVAARQILAALIAAGYLGMGLDGAADRADGAGATAAAIAEWLAWIVLWAVRGIAPGQDLLGRLAEAVTRFLIHLIVRGVTVARA